MQIPHWCEDCHLKGNHLSHFDLQTCESMQGAKAAGKEQDTGASKHSASNLCPCPHNYSHYLSITVTQNPALIKPWLDFCEAELNFRILCSVVDGCELPI